MHQSSFVRQLFFAMAGTAVGVALYVTLSPIMPEPPLYRHADGAFALYLYANFMLWWVVAAREVRIAAALFWLFFAYMVMLPAYFHLHEGFTWTASDDARNDRTVYGALMMVLVGFIAVTVGEIVGGMIRPTATRAPRPRRFNGILVGLLALAMAVIALGLGAYLGLGTFMMRRAELLDLDWASGGERGIYLIFPRGLAAFALLMYIAVAKEQLLLDRRMPFIWLAVIGIVVLPVNAIINFPLALARFWFFGILLAILLMFVSFRNFALRLGFFVSFILMFMVIMPISDEFSRGEADFGVVDEVTSEGAMYNYMLSPDLNQFSMMMNAYYYVEQVGVNYGKQILSATLFFVPRFIWPGKSLPSGGLAGEVAGYDFLVLAQPIFGELFMDGGFALLAVGGLCIGLFLRWLDRRFIRAVEDRDEPTRLWIAVYLGMSIIIYRGALGGVSPQVLTLIGLLVASAIFLTRPVQAGRVATPTSDPPRRKVAARWTGSGELRPDALAAPGRAAGPGWRRPAGLVSGRASITS